MSTAVITEAQARQVTGGARPFSIAEYDEACDKLRHCLNIDDTLKFKDFAGARAYWAKVNGEKEALKLCLALDKLAARHLAALAIRSCQNQRKSLLMCSHPNCKSTALTRGLCNNHYVQKIQRKEDLSKFPTMRKPRGATAVRNVLLDAGMNRDSVKKSMLYARIPEVEFKKAIEDGASNFSLQRMAIKINNSESASSDVWAALTNSEGLNKVRNFMRKHPPSQFARELKPAEVDKARKFAIEMVEYFDEFEQHLPKAAK